ncbi:hypothetical protein CQ056_25900 [Peribacillus simplex]|uniref:hypothetical protein n=1 Tax=Peribacillus TaxID=2675229 RepID=UPI000CFE93B5|nr:MULTISPECIES: hypothetical protein [Peribacillus]MCF7625482.1 hypothetical protein [Peribacillus frigoritolerans]PRA75739.1 hypothetical protein CQ056_25900 [Peribacillus simplex]
MTKEKKARTQYNWKFKENESKEFYDWFNKQDNISSSLRSILYHIIDVYGSNDFLDPAVQKQVFKDTFILDSLKNKDVLSVNHEEVGNLPYIKDKPNEKMPENIVNSQENETVGSNKESKEDVQVKTKSHQKEKSSVFNKVNKDLF